MTRVHAHDSPVLCNGRTIGFRMLGTPGTAGKYPPFRAHGRSAGMQGGDNLSPPVTAWRRLPETGLRFP